MTPSVGLCICRLPNLHAQRGPTSTGAWILWQFPPFVASIVSVSGEIHWPARWLHGSDLEKWAAVIQTAVAALPRHSFFLWGKAESCEWGTHVKVIMMTSCCRLARYSPEVFDWDYFWPGCHPKIITTSQDLSSGARYCYHLSIHPTILHRMASEWHHTKHVGLFLHLMQLLLGGSSSGSRPYVVTNPLNP